MSGTLLVAVILISGYFYIKDTPAERYRFKRSTGWHTYFHAAAWGIGFFSLSWVAIWVCDYIIPVQDLNKITKFLENYSPTYESTCNSNEIKFLLVCFLSLILPFIWCKIIRSLSYKIWDNCLCHNVSIPAQERAKERQLKILRSIVKHNPFESILTDANTNKTLLLLSLSSRKFYVGRIVEAPAFSHGEIEYLSFIPFFSGYRDKDNLETINTTNYVAIFSDDVDALMNNRKVIPKEKIEDISFYDPDVYEKFKQQNTPIKTKSRVSNGFSFYISYLFLPSLKHK